MQRLKDFGRFCLWCFGLGYTASVFMRDVDGLPALLDLAGMMAAIATVVQLLLIAVRQRRHAGRNQPVQKFRRIRPESTVMRVKARDHFGLRGVDR